MIMMEDKIVLMDENNQEKEYKLLAIIDKEDKYIIYTDLNNLDITNNLYVVKVKELNNNTLTIPITDDEWNMINEEYLSIIK